MEQQHNHTGEVTLDDIERQPCEVWTRVMGYHRPVSAFNPGKLREHKDRVHFQERIATVQLCETEEADCLCTC